MPSADPNPAHRLHPANHRADRLNLSWSFSLGFLENPFSSELSYLVTLTPLIKQEDMTQPLLKAI